MSYILEALKKSQQERELGQVPTLDTTSLFSEDKEPEPANRWGLLAVGLAALAVVIALYAALRTPLLPSPTVVAPDAGQSVTSGVVDQSLASTDAGAILAGTGDAPPSEASTPASEPLVEAPPPRRVARTPAPPSANMPHDDDRIPEIDFTGPYADDPYSEIYLDPELEWELQRQLDAEQADLSEPAPVMMDRPDRAPIPPDLISDIERFKQQVRRESGIPPPPSQNTAVKITGDPTRLRLTPQQQAQLPGYLMTVHVYDADISKRFVLINALKYREGEETREGLRVERILPDGAVLSYLGNPFFVAR